MVGERFSTSSNPLLYLRAGHEFKRHQCPALAMATLDLTEPIFAETIENNDIVILDFWAEWCGPCKAYGPVYERVSEKYPDVVFGKIDTEDQQELAGMFGIRSIPTTIVFKEGIGVFMQPGALPEEALQDLVEKIKEIDMDEVRAEMAEKEANES